LERLTGLAGMEEGLTLDNMNQFFHWSNKTSWNLYCQALQMWFETIIQNKPYQLHNSFIVSKTVLSTVEQQMTQLLNESC